MFGKRGSVCLANGDSDREADSPFPLFIDGMVLIRHMQSPVCLQVSPSGNDGTPVAEFLAAHAGFVWSINERGIELAYLISLALGWHWYVRL